MQLNQFNGGLNLRVAPHLISVNEGVIYSNIDNSAISLKPLKTDFNELMNVGASTSIHYFGGDWIARPLATSFVEYQEKLYYSDGVGIPQKTSDGTTFYNLGIVKPSNQLTTVPVDAVDPSETKVRQYCYTYYNSSDGSESAPSTYSVELLYTTNNITVSGLLASPDPQVTHIRLYRIGGSITEMTLVVTLANINQTYIDTITDLDVDGTLLTSYNAGQAPSGLNHLTQHNSMLFGAKNDKLYYSEVAYVNNWSPFFFLDFDSTVMGIGSTQNGLLVYTRTKTYIVTGTSPENLTKLVLHDTQGCINHKTIQYVNNALVWQSLDGLCTSNGGFVEIISEPKLGRISYDPIDSVLVDSQYYLFHSTGVLIADFRYGQLSFKSMDLLAFGAYYNDQFDKIYYVDGLGDVYSLFEGNSVRTYKYKTGKISDGSISNVKIYKVVYIYIVGTATLKTYIDGDLKSTVSLVSGFNEVLLPSSSLRGYYIEFELEGTGELLELEYKVEGRQNGR